VLTALEDWDSGDKRGLVAIHALHEAAAAGRHVVDQFGLEEPQAIEVDQIDVGAQSRSKPAPVGKSEESRSLVGLPSYQKLKGQARPAMSLRSAHKEPI